MGNSQYTQISKSSTENHLHSLAILIALIFGFHISEKTNKQTKILPDHISTCNSLPRHDESVLFLKHIMTSNEKWILYTNVELKRSCSK